MTEEELQQNEKAHSVWTDLRERMADIWNWLRDHERRITRLEEDHKEHD